MIYVDLLKTEAKIKDLLTLEKQSWVDLYKLLKEVEDSRAWQSTQRSFSAWIKHLSVIANVHESSIWRKKKAGEIYYQYHKRAKYEGISSRAISDEKLSKISPENLIYTAKISQGDTRTQDDMIDDLIAGNLKRSNLKAAWEAVKHTKQAHGIKVSPANHYESVVITSVA